MARICLEPHGYAQVSKMSVTVEIPERAAAAVVKRFVNGVAVITSLSLSFSFPFGIKKKKK